MNQQELTNAIAKRFFLTKTESREIIKFILTKVTEELTKGERVYIRGFGSFTKETRARKRVRHPKTKKIITIPQQLTVKFNPSKPFLQKLK